MTLRSFEHKAISATLNIYQVCFFISPTLDFFSQKIHLFGPIHIKSLPKSKLGLVGVGLNMAQNHSSSP